MKYLILLLILVAATCLILWRPAEKPEKLPPPTELEGERIPPPREVSANPKAIELTPEVKEKLREIAYQAAREGDTMTLKEYFASGLPVNDVNSRGDTLLILATYHGHEDATKLILAQPTVKIEARNGMGLTALSGVAFKGHLPLAKLLIKAGAEVNASNASGQTPLMFAALTGRTEMVKFLIESGADVAARDQTGKSALDLAEMQGATDTCTVLRAALKK